MADRKYQQKGYQGYRKQDPERRGEPWRAETPRGAMLAQRTVSRCGACGDLLPIATGSLEAGPTCRAAIHACRQCAHFDVSQRFQCTPQPPSARWCATSHAASRWSAGSSARIPAARKARAT